MHTNEFEKQVQQKMEELKLHPSDSVWANIRARITKEKRPGRALIFLPIIIICFTYGGYLLLNRNNSNEYGKQSSKNFERIINNKKEKNRLDSINQNQGLIDYKKPFARAIIAENDRVTKRRTHDESKLNSSYGSAKTLVKRISHGDEREFDKTKNIAENKKLSADIEITIQEKTITGEEHKSDIIAIAEDDLINQIELDLPKDATENKTENPVSSGNKKIITANKHLWNWGLNFSIGSSGIANSLFASGQKSFDVTSMSSAAQLNNPYYSPSLIKSSLAFITGFSVEKNISPKIILATGLNYELFSTTNKVGPDSAAYFRLNSDFMTHHNFYHYIALPIGLKFKIAHLSKTQLYWNIGFSISQLITTNALQFNNTAGIYYHDNSQLNKTQIRFNAGPDILLSSKQNRSLLIGPYVSYGISKVAGQGYNKHHFTFIGLRTQFIFTKK